MRLFYSCCCKRKKRRHFHRRPQQCPGRRQWAPRPDGEQEPEFHVGGADGAAKLQIVFPLCFNVNIKSSVLSKTEDILIGNRWEQMNHQVAPHHPRLGLFLALAVSVGRGLAVTAVAAIHRAFAVRQVLG